MSGATKLSQDMATLINNRQGSDIQFKVGSGGTSTLQGNGDDDSATATLYAHSVILRCRSRYFANMLDEETNWKENLNGVIYKPNMSSGTLQDVLHYIYTGDVRVKTSKDIIELIAAADEMDLEELSLGCQNELIRTVKHIFSDKYENESAEEVFEGSTKHRVPIDVAIRTHIIPALNLASSHSLSHLSSKLLNIMLPNISVIIKSPDAYTTFISNISSESLLKIISSDNLAITERSVWDLALSWACYQTDLSKVEVEARLSTIEDDEDDNKEESSDGSVISSTDLNQLKKTLSPFLPAIRFSLLDPDDYAHMTDILSYLLPRRRFSELSRYFVSHTGQLDTPRVQSRDVKGPPNIMLKLATWELLRKKIFETGGIAGCPSFKNLKFDLLFRASEHGFLARTFHQRCDDKGPTLTLVRSADGYLFGGVNFSHWKSDSSYSISPLNFLFALPDGQHRKNTLIFKNDGAHYSSGNFIDCGPCFKDAFYIANSANSSRNSYGILPFFNNGSENLETPLAGAQNFTISNYEVLAISRK